MHTKTILNRVQKHIGFVYGNERLVQLGNQLMMEVPIRARKGSRGICSKCGRPAPGYDRLPELHFQFIPYCGILVFFLYAMRRVNCPRCGITVERVPWAVCKSPITQA